MRNCAAVLAIVGLVIPSLCTGQTVNHRGADALLTKPEAVGFSSERLENLHKIIQDEVDAVQQMLNVVEEQQHLGTLDLRAQRLQDVYLQSNFPD